jgi:hypothetical protein
MDKHQIISAACVAFALQCIMCRSAFGMRFLRASVALNGQVVLRSAYEDGSRVDGATVWRYWGTEPMSGEVSHPLEASNADPLRVTLVGSLYLKFEHVNRIIVDGRANKLTLIRTHIDSNLWFLPRAEVERIAQLSGIPAAPPDYSELLGCCLPFSIVVVGAVILLCIAARRERRESQESGSNA